MRSELSSLPMQAPERISRRRTVVGFALLGVPLFVIGVFAVAEGIGGEEGWWGHLIQLGVLGILAGAAWARPRLVGPVLVVLGAAFAGWIALNDGGEGVANLAAILIVAVPLVAAGILLSLASWTRTPLRPPE